MSLKDTCKNLRTLIANVAADLDKAENGNKAASQRVRTGTIKLEKISKLFRKESIKSEKAGGGKKKKSAPAKAPKASSAKPAAAKTSTAKVAPKKSSKPPVKAKKAKPKAALKKPTAKILKKTKK